MRLSSSVLLLASSVMQAAASSWSFDDGSVTVASKGSGSKVQEKFRPKAPPASVVTLGSGSVAKVLMTITEDGQAKRPHQAFVLLQDVDSGLEAPFPLAMKESGKATVQISEKNIPVQLLLATKPLRVSAVIGSFGASEGFVQPIFDLALPASTAAASAGASADENAAAAATASASAAYEAPERYGKKPEIHHIFRADPRSPPKVVSLVFTLAVAAAVPALFAGWLLLGANVNHLGKALATAPVAHGVFYGSIVALEGVFFLYYTSWNLFQTLPVVGLVGAVTVVSGSRALGEVQARRLAGER